RSHGGLVGRRAGQPAGRPGLPVGRARPRPPDDGTVAVPAADRDRRRGVARPGIGLSSWRSADSDGPTLAVMKVRRVVTGHDANGKAIVASDTEVDGFRPMLNPGSEFHTLWGADEAPRFPD